MSKEQKGKIKEYQSKRYQQLIKYKKEALQNKWLLSLLSVRMSEKTLKFDNIVVNKKEFHKSKQPTNLDLVNVDQIVISFLRYCKEIANLLFWVIWACLATHS